MSSASTITRSERDSVSRLVIGAPVKLAPSSPEYLREFPSAPLRGWHIVTAAEGPFFKVEGSDEWVPGERIADYATKPVHPDNEPAWRAPWWNRLRAFAANPQTAGVEMASLIRAHVDAYRELDIGVGVEDERGAAGSITNDDDGLGSREGKTLLAIMRHPATSRGDRLARANYLQLLGEHGEWVNTNGAERALIEGWLAAEDEVQCPRPDLSSLSLSSSVVVLEALYLAADALMGVANRPNAGDADNPASAGFVADQYWEWLNEEKERLFDHVLATAPASSSDVFAAERVFMRYYGSSERLSFVQAEFAKWGAGHGQDVKTKLSTSPKRLPHEGYNLDDLQSDLGHMTRLMDVIANMVVDGPDSAGGPDYQRLNSLVWIGRDMAERIDGLVVAHYQEIGTTRSRRVSS